MPWYNDSWTKRLKVTVESSEVDEDANDFPVYVKAADLPAEFHTNVKAGGVDVRFTTSDEVTEIPREIVFYDAASDTGEFYFKGNISASVDTEFWLYYGNPAASDYAVDATYGAENTWEADYAGVWHMQEDPSGSSPQILDSTSNDEDMTSYGTMLTEDSVTGKLSGKALDFDGSNDKIFKTIGYNPNGYPFSVSLWMKPDTDGNNRAVAHYGSGGTPKMEMQQHSSDIARVYIPNAYEFGGTFVVDTWVNYCVTHGDGTGAIYLDGDPVDPIRSSILSNDNSDLHIGYGEYATNDYFSGIIDEVRVSKVVRSANRMKTDHNNQNSPATFLTFGSEESGGGGGGNPWYQYASERGVTS